MHMPRNARVFFVVSLVFFGASCQPQPAKTPRILSERKAPNPASVDRITRDLKTLTSPDLEGRGPGSQGLLRASELLAQEFELAKLLPAGDNGYFASFGAPAVETGVGVSGTFGGSSFSNISYMISYGGVSKADLKGELVYDELEEEPIQSLTGKIVVTPEWLREDFTTKSVKERVQRAKDAGAIAVLTVPHIFYPPPFDPPSLGELEIPVARVHPNLSTLWMGSFPVEMELHFVGRELLSARNVVGAIPGKSDGAAIVISAHYDHIGLGRPNWERDQNTLHPGADDNASGTAALMEIARILSEMPSCERPVLFVGYAYEEVGLLGSEALVNSMRSNIGMVINLDMVGRRYDLPIEVNGKPSKEMRGALFEVMQDRWFYGSLPNAKEGPQSDHTTFILRDIPAMTLTTGLHNDHHRPTDTIDKLDIPGIAKIVDQTVAIVRELNCR
jgi:aminopeptidase YwaD